MNATPKKLDELMNPLLELPALENLFVNCTMPVNILKVFHKRGVHWMHPSE